MRLTVSDMVIDMENETDKNDKKTSSPAARYCNCYPPKTINTAEPQSVSLADFVTSSHYNISALGYRIPGFVYSAPLQVVFKGSDYTAVSHHDYIT